LNSGSTRFIMRCRESSRMSHSRYSATRGAAQKGRRPACRAALLFRVNARKGTDTVNQSVHSGEGTLEFLELPLQVLLGRQTAQEAHVGATIPPADEFLDDLNLRSHLDLAAS